MARRGVPAAGGRSARGADLSALATLLRVRRLLGNERLDRDALRAMQDRLVRGIVEHARETVPYYRDLFARAGAGPGRIATVSDLRHLPVTTKADLQAAGQEAITSNAFDPSDLVEERTTGSSGRPFSVRVEREWLDVRRALFLRALWRAGYRPGRRMLWLAGDAPRAFPGWSRIRELSYGEEPRRVAEELERFRPALVYGWVSPLRSVAEHLRNREAGSERPHRVRAVVTTAEQVDEVTRRLLESSFGGAVFDLYGMTEVGPVGWECARHDGYHVAEDSVVVEEQPPDGSGSGSGEGEGRPAPEAARIVVTGLLQRGTPMIRYRTGDLVLPGPAGNCSCGSVFRRLGRIGGRSLDAVSLPDGRVISPYRFTLALEKIPGISRYQIVQERRGRIIVRLEEEPGRGSDPGEAARRSVVEIVGPQVEIEVRSGRRFDPEPGTKFRVVVSRVTGSSER